MTTEKTLSLPRGTPAREKPQKAQGTGTSKISPVSASADLGNIPGKSSREIFPAVLASLTHSGDSLMSLAQSPVAFAASFVPFAVSAVAVEIATAEAKAVNNGMVGNAWAAASAIAAAANSAAATAATRAAIFKLASAEAVGIFAAARLADGALEEAAKWPAFASAASTAARAIGFGVWVDGMKKAEAAKAAKAADDSITRAAIPEAIRLGLVMAETNPEAVATALRAQLAAAHVEAEAKAKAAKAEADTLRDDMVFMSSMLAKAKAEAEAATAEAAKAKAEAAAMQADMLAAEAKAAKAKAKA